MPDPLASHNIDTDVDLISVDGCSVSSLHAARAAADAVEALRGFLELPDGPVRECFGEHQPDDRAELPAHGPAERLLCGLPEFLQPRDGVFDSLGATAKMEEPNAESSPQAMSEDLATLKALVSQTRADTVCGLDGLEAALDADLGQLSRRLADLERASTSFEPAPASAQLEKIGRRLDALEARTNDALRVDALDGWSSRVTNHGMKFVASAKAHSVLVGEMQAATRRRSTFAADPLPQEGFRSIHRRVKLLEEVMNSNESASDALGDQVAELAASFADLRRDVAGSQLLEPKLSAYDARIRVLEGRLGIERFDDPIGYPDEPVGFYPQFVFDD